MLEQLARIRDERRAILKQVKLFNYFFLNVYKSEGE